MSKVKDWLQAIPSANTRKSYEHGLRKFEEFYVKGIETLIGDKNAGKTIERFYVWLKQRYGQNTCRNYVNAPVQFLKYFETEVKYRKSLGIYKTVVTTRDHRITIDQVQEMAKVADLREQVLLEVFLLGLRVGDVAESEWKTFDVDGEAPIPIEVLTKKENVVAKTFISEEFQQLLTKHLAQIDQKNPYLFQSARKGHLTAKRINAIFKELGERAGIKTHGLFRWHIGRKLFLRTCAELGVNQWNAKLMCGKSISADILTYINGVKLQQDFEKVFDVLKLFPQISQQDFDRVERLEEALIELEKNERVANTRIEALQTALEMSQKKIDRLGAFFSLFLETTDASEAVKEHYRRNLNILGVSEEIKKEFEGPFKLHIKKRKRKRK